LLLRIGPFSGRPQLRKFGRVSLLGSRFQSPSVATRFVSLDRLTDDEA
jgi:hypothetical protein